MNFKTKFPNEDHLPKSMKTILVPKKEVPKDKRIIEISLKYAYSGSKFFISPEAKEDQYKD